MYIDKDTPCASFEAFQKAIGVRSIHSCGVTEYGAEPEFCVYVKTSSGYANYFERISLPKSVCLQNLIKLPNILQEYMHKVAMEVTIEKNQGLRYNENKLKWSLVHFGSLEPMVRVLMFGAKKYAPENWKKGLDKKEILESIMRHVAELMDGKELDDESGLPIMGHIQCNAMFYNYFSNYKGITKECINELHAKAITGQ